MAQQQQTELSRDLGLFTITMVGVAAMIGAGIFVLTGIAAGTAGPALMLAFAANGVVTLLTALAYAELGSAIPEAGGGYLWVKEGLPGPNAFLAGWMSWFAHAVAGSLYALGFSSYVGYLLHQFGVHTFIGIPVEAAFFQKGLAVLIALIFAAINLKGVSETGLIGNIVTVTKVLIIGLFIGSGLWVMFNGGASHWHKFTPLLPKGFTGVFSAMGLTVIAFEGYEIIVQTAEEVKNPKKNIPRAVIWSLLIVIPIYILVAIVAIGAVDPGTAQPTWQWLGDAGELGLAKAASQFMPLGTPLLILGGLLATMSALNATTFSSTRVSFAMGRDRNLPDFFAKISESTRTPYLALLASEGLIIFMVLAIPIEDVAAAADIMFLLLFLQVNVAIITIRRKYADKLDYGFLIPFFPFTPILAIILMIVIAVFMFQISALGWFFVIAWISAGFLIYYTYARKREQEKKRSPVVMEQSLSTNDTDRYRILVPVANPDSAEKLINFAALAAKAHEAELLLIHVITIPKQSPYEVGQRYVKQARDNVMDKAMEMAANQGVTASSVMRIAREPAKAIIDTVEEHHIDLVVMGWQGKRNDPTTIIGPSIDNVLRHAHCNVAVLRGEDFTNIKDVFIPLSYPKQAQLMLEMGEILAQDTGANINLYHMISPKLDHDKKAKQRQLDNLYKSLSDGEKKSDSRKEMKHNINIEVTDRVNQTIADLSSSHGVTIIGAGREGWFKKLVATTRTERIANLVNGRLILVKQSRTGIKSGFLDIAEFFRSTEPISDSST